MKKDKTMPKMIPATIMAGAPMPTRISKKASSENMPEFRSPLVAPKNNANILRKMNPPINIIISTANNHLKNFGATVKNMANIIMARIICIILFSEIELQTSNAQVHRKNRRSEAKAGFSGATPC